MSIRLNISNFIKLQGDMTESEISEKLNISRSHLWRVKTKSSAVGQEFIMKFKKTFPDEKFDDYFFIEDVDLSQHRKKL